MINNINKQFENYGFKDTHGNHNHLLSCVDFRELVKDVETLRKVRAVLSANKFDVEVSKDLVKTPTYETSNADRLCVALIDAIGGES